MLSAAVVCVDIKIDQHMSFWCLLVTLASLQSSNGSNSCRFHMKNIIDKVIAGKVQVNVLYFSQCR